VSIGVVDMRIEPNVWVTVRYRLYDSQGEALEEGEREWTYLHGGYGAVFPKVEAALAGRGSATPRRSTWSPRIPSETTTRSG
jgi:hypothetical protein